MKEFSERPRLEDPQEQELVDRLETFPNDASTLTRLQAYYRERARYEDEVAILRELLERDLSPSERAETLHDLAYALYRQDKLEEAIANAENLLKAYPDYHHLSSVFWLLGVMYAARMNRPERLEMWHQDRAVAESHLKRALDYVDDEQDRAGILVELGGTLMSTTSKLEEAKLALQRALAIGIKDPQILTTCHQRLGRIYYRLDQVEQARQHYEQSVLADPERPSDFRALAYVYLAGLDREQGKYELAERRCQQARLAMDESSPRGASVVLESIYEELGDIAFCKKEYRRAIENYQAALQQPLLPEQGGHLYYMLGVSLKLDEQYERALKSFRQALVLEQSSPSANQEHVGELLFQIGQCYYSLSDFQQAIILLQKASEQVERPSLAELQLWLGHSYFSLKRYERAASAYEQVIREADRKSPHGKEAKRYLRAAKRLKGSNQ